MEMSVLSSNSTSIFQKGCLLQERSSLYSSRLLKADSTHVQLETRSFSSFPFHDFCHSAYWSLYLTIFNFLIKTSKTRQNIDSLETFNHNSSFELRIKEIQIILRLFLVIAMYCKASSSQFNQSLNLPHY